MASEITYAEVKFKNESPAPVVKVPPETKKPEHHPQKYPLWLPWSISLLLLLVCFALVVILLVVPFCHSTDQPTALQQQFSEWKCDSAVPQVTARGWTCCPKDWRRFQRSCYFLSSDTMNWAESEQNCTGMGSQLVVINSKEEQVFLSMLMKKPPKRENFYIGLFEEKMGKWQWVDKTPYNVSAAFWRKGEPSDYLDENCTVMHVLEKSLNNWNDVRSDLMHHRICEVAAVTV
ncbi:PREDICTED: C-type lectin domain family 4 member A [Pseudopodoces humilis]|uniref:C-type lectin domain family 4 member A n=1 Tax=Pseudopodoces humilis TaxID=181119 RepID=UPI0003956FA8|nr:PREDICTED: C-type lectin domain family 4 member A [Pseudopodoces humilis]